MLASADLETEKLSKIRAEVNQFSPSTTARFSFDSYCSAQVFLFFEPAASGAVFWDIPLLSSTEYVYESPFAAHATGRPIEPTINGALLVDSGQLFSIPYCSYRNTSLQSLPASSSAPGRGITPRWTNFLEYLFALSPSPSGATVEAPTDAAASLAPPLSTPYANLLHELHSTSPWRSWKKLAPLLGTSHMQLQRVARGETKVPQAELASRIDELYSFVKRLSRISGGDATATTRLLTTRRVRDGATANEFLLRQDYRNAFRSVMEAASPRKAMQQVDALPYRWYDEPSKDLYDDGAERDE